MSTETCTVYHVPELTGPLLLGYQFNWALYGILCAQVYIYSQATRVDNWIPQTLVYGLLLIETLQSVLSTHDGFHELVLSWGEPTGLEGLYYTWIDLPIITGVVSAITQCYYGWRLYVLSKSRILSIAIFMLALMQCGAAFAEGIRSKIIDGNSTLDVPKDTFTPTTIWLSGSAACDIIISASMAHFLAKSRVGFAKVDAALSSVVRLVIETGIATSVCAIIQLALFIKYQDATYYVVPALVLSKLYSNSMLVMLNNHIPLRHDAQTTTSDVPARLARNIFQGSGAIRLSMNHEQAYSEGVSMVDLTPHKQTESFSKVDPSNVV